MSKIWTKAVVLMTTLLGCIGLGLMLPGCAGEGGGVPSGISGAILNARVNVSLLSVTFDSSSPNSANLRRLPPGVVLAPSFAAFKLILKQASADGRDVVYNYSKDGSSGPSDLLEEALYVRTEQSAPSKELYGLYVLRPIEASTSKNPSEQKVKFVRVNTQIQKELTTYSSVGVEPLGGFAKSKSGSSEEEIVETWTRNGTSIVPPVGSLFTASTEGFKIYRARPEAAKVLNTANLDMVLEFKINEKSTYQALIRTKKISAANAVDGQIFLNFTDETSVDVNSAGALQYAATGKFKISPQIDGSAIADWSKLGVDQLVVRVLEQQAAVNNGNTQEAITAVFEKTFSRGKGSSSFPELTMDVVNRLKPFRIEVRGSITNGANGNSAPLILFGDTVGGSFTREAVQSSEISNAGFLTQGYNKSISAGEEGSAQIVNVELFSTLRPFDSPGKFFQPVFPEINVPRLQAGQSKSAAQPLLVRVKTVQIPTTVGGMLTTQLVECPADLLSYEVTPSELELNPGSELGYVTYQETTTVTQSLAKVRFNSVWKGLAKYANVDPLEAPIQVRIGLSGANADYRLTGPDLLTGTSGIYLLASVTENNSDPASKLKPFTGFNTRKFVFDSSTGTVSSSKLVTDLQLPFVGRVDIGYTPVVDLYAVAPDSLGSDNTTIQGGVKVASQSLPSFKVEANKQSYSAPLASFTSLVQPSSLQIELNGVDQDVASRRYLVTPGTSAKLKASIKVLGDNSLKEITAQNLVFDIPASVRDQLSVNDSTGSLMVNQTKGVLSDTDVDVTATLKVPTELNGTTWKTADYVFTVPIRIVRDSTKVQVALPQNAGGTALRFSIEEMSGMDPAATVKNTYSNLVAFDPLLTQNTTVSSDVRFINLGKVVSAGTLRESFFRRKVEIMSSAAQNAVVLSTGVSPTVRYDQLGTGILGDPNSGQVNLTWRSNVGELRLEDDPARAGQNYATGETIRLKASVKVNGTFVEVPAANFFIVANGAGVTPSVDRTRGTVSIPSGDLAANASFDLNYSLPLPTPTTTVNPSAGTLKINVVKTTVNFPSIPLVGPLGRAWVYQLTEYDSETAGSVTATYVRSMNRDAQSAIPTFDLGYVNRPGRFYEAKISLYDRPVSVASDGNILVNGAVLLGTRTSSTRKAATAVSSGFSLLEFGGWNASLSGAVAISRSVPAGFPNLAPGETLGIVTTLGGTELAPENFDWSPATGAIGSVSNGIVTISRSYIGGGNQTLNASVSTTPLGGSLVSASRSLTVIRDRVNITAPNVTASSIGRSVRYFVDEFESADGSGPVKRTFSSVVDYAGTTGITSGQVEIPQTGGQTGNRSYRTRATLYSEPDGGGVAIATATSNQVFRWDTLADFSLGAWNPSTGSFSSTLGGSTAVTLTAKRGNTLPIQLFFNSAEFTWPNIRVRPSVTGPGFSENAGVLTVNPPNSPTASTGTLTLTIQPPVGAAVTKVYTITVPPNRGSGGIIIN